MAGFIIISEEPKIIQLNDGEKFFGSVSEITSRAVGALRANVAEVTLWGADFLHHHKEAEETYICTKGKGELYLGDNVIDFVLGVRVIIKPNTLHATRPKGEFERLTFLCVASPAFSPDDVYNHELGRRW
ncbi:MAG: hypothetical protein ABIC36_01145 [bacterium]